MVIDYTYRADSVILISHPCMGRKIGDSRLSTMALLRHNTNVVIIMIEELREEEFLLFAGNGHSTRSLIIPSSSTSYTVADMWIASRRPRCMAYTIIYIGKLLLHVHLICTYSRGDGIANNWSNGNVPRSGNGLFSSA